VLRSSLSFVVTRVLGTRAPRLRPLPAEWAAATRPLVAAVEAERLREDVRGLPGPRSDLHPDARHEHIRETRRILVDSWSDSGWSVEQRPYALKVVRGIDDDGQERASACAPPGRGPR
jgi:hypothetical protein